MTGVPIPDDWSGDEWECYTISFPKSKQWTGVLKGLLWTLTRGRTWDKETGGIYAIQEIGWQIFNANDPLSVCSTDGGSSDGGGHGDDSPIANYSDWFDGDGCDCESCEGDIMGNCCLSQSIRIENGVLQVADCGKWVDVGSVGSSSQKQSQDDPTNVKPDGTTTTESDFACAKATAYVELLWKVMYAGWDHFRDAPWSVIKNIQAAAGIDLNNNYVAMMIVAIVDADATETDLHDIVENTPKAEAICRLSKKLDGSVAAMTDADKERVIGMREWLSTDPLEWAYIDVCNDAIGDGNYDRVGRAACLDPNFDCTCPQVTPPDEIIPVTHDWAITMDFTQGHFGFGTPAPWTPEHGGNKWVAGEGWVSYADPSDNTGGPVAIRRAAPRLLVTGDPEAHCTYVKIFYTTWGRTVPDYDPNWINVFASGWLSGRTWANKPEQVWSGESDDIYDHMIVTNPSSAWWNLQPSGAHWTISKMIIAGTGIDRWTGLNPDGTYTP